MSIYLDNYCERAGQVALWSEPVNALSNLAFVFAALLAFKAMRRINPPAFADGYLLCTLLFCIGIGSFIWHVWPTSSTIMMDVIPITLFINVYLITFLKRGFGWHWWQVSCGFLALQFLNVVAALFFNPDTLHGTIMYLPTYGMLVGMVAYSQWKRIPSARSLFAVTLLWTLSLICRTIDIPLCAALPIGTHFLWHLLNASVLYKLLIVLLKVRLTSRNELST